MNRFTKLMEEMSYILDTPITPEKGGKCRFRVNDLFPIQIEMDKSGEKFFLIAMITELPPGKFREKVLKEAMKENIYGSIGVLSYMDRNNHLMLHKKFFSEDTDAEMFTDELEAFLRKSIDWYQAIQRGSAGPHPVSLTPEDKPPPGMKL